MRFVSCSAAVAASLFLLSPTAQAVTNLGAFSGWQVFGVGGDTDASSYPDIKYTVSFVDAFKVIKFTLAKPLDLRLDVAWLDSSGFISGSVGTNATEVDYLVDLSVRAADGHIVTSAPGPTYFHSKDLVIDKYGAIQVPRTTPSPVSGQLFDAAYQRQQQSTAKLYKSLPAGDYTATVFVSRGQGGLVTGNRQPHAEVGLYTGPATDFAAYQDALAAPIGLGASTVVAGDLTASGITTSTEPNAMVCPVALTLTDGTFGKFTASVTVGNPASMPLNGWTVNGGFASAALLYGPKNAKLSQKGGYKTFTATPVAANTTLKADGATTFTFSGIKGSSALSLTSLTLTAGGKTCTAVPAAQ